MSADLHALHVRSSAGLYGAEYVILGLVPALASIGIDSTLLCLDNQHLDEQLFYNKARALGLRAERVPCRGRFDFATVHALRRAIDAQPNAVLHVHDYKSALFAWLARGRRRVPIIITAHGQFSFTPALQLYHRIELGLMRRFDRVCAVAAQMQPLLEGAGVPRANIRIVENGIDTIRFTPQALPLPRADFDIADDAIVFGAAMRLTEQKNPLGLVAAFAQVAAQLPRAVLIIAGDGPLRSAIVQSAKAHGVEQRIRLAGVCADMARFYTMLDTFVLPSHYEGLPLSLLEAMAAGCKVVSTRVGQVGQVLAGLDIQTVPPSDVDALARAMCAAALRPLCAAGTRERVVERYSTARMAHAYAQIYRELWSCRGRLAA
jgi:glycosyltransferase involved in cell wall biosynthesis